MNGSSTDASSPAQHERFVAALLDGIIATGLTALLGGVPLVGGVVGGLYLIARDGVEVGPLRFRSPGKYVMGLDLVRLDGRPVSLETSVQRNWMLGLSSVAGAFIVVPIVGGALASLLSLAGLGLILFEVYNVFTDPVGRRWGDRLGSTKVVAAGDGLV
ncbi:RDD family protein [Salinibacter altiplanensis]|uniref:RDD family protein n=1 Tax=Salinibacter altiplanensis TaxID=1803181 RepID=UPI000C9FA70C|nr:RDD family protein [Salinibacter altiplanensis]